MKGNCDKLNEIIPWEYNEQHVYITEAKLLNHLH